MIIEYYRLMMMLSSFSDHATTRNGIGVSTTFQTKADRAFGENNPGHTVPGGFNHRASR